MDLQSAQVYMTGAGSPGALCTPRVDVMPHIAVSVSPVLCTWRAGEAMVPCLESVLGGHNSEPLNSSSLTTLRSLKPYFWSPRFF